MAVRYCSKCRKFVKYTEYQLKNGKTYGADLWMCTKCKNNK